MPAKSPKKRKSPKSPKSQRTITERGALEALKIFLQHHDASLESIDSSALNEIEGNWAKVVREHVECVRLIGVPKGVEGVWQTFAMLYLTYLHSKHALSLSVSTPCTVFVAERGGVFHPMLVRKRRSGLLNFSW